MTGGPPFPGNADRARHLGRKDARKAGLLLLAVALLWGQAAFAWSFGVCPGASARLDEGLARHEHRQQVEEWGGTRVVVSGGAGAPMYPFQRHGFYRIRLEDGAVRETFVRIRVGGNDP